MVSTNIHIHSSSEILLYCKIKLKLIMEFSINNRFISSDFHRGSSSNRCNWSLHMVDWEVGGSHSESHGIGCI